MKPTPGTPFKTSDLDCAAYLLTRDFKLLDVERGMGNRSNFIFDASAAAVAPEFYGGAVVSAQDYGSAIREVKAAIFRNPNPTATKETPHASPRRQQ